MPGKYYGIKKAAKSVYRQAQKHVPKGTMSNIGRSVGSSYGAADFGAAVGQQVANITGVGAYGATYKKTSKPRSRSIMNKATSYSPIVKSSGDGENLTISNTEYVMDLYAGATGTPTDFDIDEFSLNPGLDVEAGGLFAWLPNLANAYSQYTFKQCVISYRSKSGNATGADTSLGSVFMSSNYVSTDNAPRSKGDMLNSQYAVSAPPDKNVNFPIECRSSNKTLKMNQIRTGALKSDQNEDMFDFAKVFIATQGLQTTGQLLGEIWISYTVEFSKKRKNDRSDLIRTANYRQAYTAGQGPTGAYPLGLTDTYPATALQPSPNNALELVIRAPNLAGSQTVAFPEFLASGVYLFTLKYRCAALSALTWTSPTLSIANGALYNCLYPPTSVGGQVSAVNDNYQTTPTSYTVGWTWVINITGKNCVVTVSNTGILDSDITAMQLMVTEINPNAFEAGI